MAARQTRMLIAAGGILVAIGAVVVLVRESSTPMARDEGDSGKVDAGVSAEADAEAKADASADADAQEDAQGESGTGTGTGTGADAGAGRGEAGARAVVTVGETGNGKTVELAVGQQLVVRLGANPSTGFDWAVIKAPAALGAPAMSYAAGGDQPGAPGTRRLAWTLKSALPAGDQPLELGYARSFEKGVAPFKTFKLVIRAAH